MKRNKEILIISGIFFLFRLTIFLATISMALTSTATQFQFSTWIQRTATHSAHLIILLLTFKFPKYFTDLHSPILLLLNLSSLLHVSTNPTSKIQLAGNIIGLCFFLTAGLLTNSRWILTCPAMIATTVGKVSYYAIDLEINDYTVMIQFVVNLGLLCYASYATELGLKTQLIQIAQIRKMNDDLQNILLNFPEGIILYSDDSKSIIMANQELKRILKCNSLNDDMKPLISKVSKEILRPVNLLNQQEQNNTLNESQLNIKYSLVKAPVNFQDGQCFLVDDLDDDIQGGQPESAETNDSIENQKEMITIRENKIFYQDKMLRMIMIKCLTPLMKYEKLKLENHFYEMLTATVSHDMRTPLNSILNLVGNIRTQVQDERGLKLLQIVENSSQMLLFLVNDLLDFTQIKNGKFRKNEQLVNIRNAVQNALDVVRLAISEKGLNLEFKCSDRVPDELITDSQRINQVLLNLLQNALKFTPKGIIRVHVDYQDHSDTLKFQVKDQGCGIKSEDKKKLFTLFGKLEATAQINTSGIGLGLNICKKIVELFGGNISVEDNVDGIGSTFAFSIKCITNYGKVQFQSPLESQRSNMIFPLEEEEKQQLIDDPGQIVITLNDDSDSGQPNFEEANANISNDYNTDSNFIFSEIQKIQGQTLARKKEKEPALLEKKKSSQLKVGGCNCQSLLDVLVVDDNIFNIVTLQTILEFQYNIRSDKAMHGQEALELVHSRYDQSNNVSCQCQNDKRNYKIIFMDCNMPIMDGFKASQEIKKLDTTNNNQIYIVALTAYTTENFKEKSIECGMDLFINKPVNSFQISKILREKGLL
ncbi:multi-sensor hybrid histidine kinase [Stylonychia lemnae]|uniref:Multi-sensor hybrid histidine kinase n=1 Tax=Stylonychia lemnae TaxID=5949 RepID=A0A077ZZ84_STYLE|nr:multi-sensor hybrid histidine kinase [Stylonychia lemnae]|eukprot:CDW74528.1 multi-sensor hybrid histidine kinase [Stylonychia lemnae]